MLNPWDGHYPLVCDWACHIARGSSGGDDYAMPVGTPILASFDGTLTNRPPVEYPASGNVAILTRADGIAFYHLHLSQFVAPGPYRQGDVIGYSGGALGAPGSGQSTGPHLHVNAYNPTGQIRDIHDYYGPDTASSSAPTPINTQPTEELPMQITTNDSGPQPAEIVIADIYARAREIKEIVAELRTITTNDSGNQPTALVLADIYARAREIRQLSVELAKNTNPTPAPGTLNDTDIERIAKAVVAEFKLAGN